MIVALLGYTRDNLGTSLWIVDSDNVPDVDLSLAVTAAIANRDCRIGPYEISDGCIFGDVGYIVPELQENTPFLLELPQTIEAAVDFFI